MSRRKVTIKYFPVPDGTYNSYLVNILISRIVKSGKKTLAQNIVNDTFDVIKYRLNVNPLEIFETAVKNVTPIIEVKAKRFGGAKLKGGSSEVKLARSLTPLVASTFRSTLCCCIHCLCFSMHSTEPRDLWKVCVH